MLFKSIGLSLKYLYRTSLITTSNQKRKKLKEATQDIAQFTLRCRGVARNTYLGGPGCNRDIPNIIFKSIGYKIINFLILLYT